MTEWIERKAAFVLGSCITKGMSSKGMHGLMNRDRYNHAYKYNYKVTNAQAAKHTW